MTDRATTTGPHGTDDDGSTPRYPNRQEVLAHIATGLENPPVGVVLLEILLSVDNVGEPVDQSLVESTIANRIKKETAPQDLVLFTGPGRLTIIRSGLTAPAETEGFAMRIQGALQQPLLVGEGRVSCQSAIGVAVSRSGDSAERLAQFVEHALSDARMLGGDMMVAFDDQDRDLLAQ